MPAKVLGGLVAVIFAAAVVVGIWGAEPTQANNKWGKYHWERAANPAAIEIVDSTSGSWGSVLSAVVADWDASSVLALGTLDGAANSACGPLEGRVRVCNGAYGANGWLGLASIWLDGSHIIQGTAQVNDSYFASGTYDDANARRHVLCQEVGHTFGLGHDKKSASCMNDLFGLFSAGYVSPSAHDYDQLLEIYAHLDGVGGDGGGGGGGKPPWAGGPGGNNGHGSPAADVLNALPADAGPADGDVFIRRLESGITLVTFVTWVSPGAGGAP